MDPWAEAERRNLDVRLVELPAATGGGAMVYDDGLILIDRRLHPWEQRAMLCHELVHHERGPLRPSLGWVVVREERRINDEVARRLVPHAGLRALGGEGGVQLWQVMETFEVPMWVAERAVALAGAMSSA